MENISNLKKEVDLISKIFYKSKNQFRSSILISKINEVRRKGRLFMKNNTGLHKDKLKKACMDLYISASSYSVMGHFEKLTSILFAISGRIFTQLEFYCDYKDEIDDIFGDL